MSNANEGWFPDPTGRHQYRWWTGAAWGDHVADNGATMLDPMAAPPPPVSPGPAAPPPPSAGWAPSATPVSQPYQPPAYGSPQAYPQGYQPPPLVQPTRVAWAALAGAVVAFIGTLLNWIDVSGFTHVTRNGFDPPVQFLFDYKTESEGGFSVGVIILLCALVAVAAAFVPQRGPRIAGRVAGVVASLSAALFLVQTYRLADFAGLGFGDVVSAGAFVSLVGGLLMAAGSRIPS